MTSHTNLYALATSAFASTPAIKVERVADGVVRLSEARSASPFCWEINHTGDRSWVERRYADFDTQSMVTLGSNIQPSLEAAFQFVADKLLRAHTVTPPALPADGVMTA